MGIPHNASNINIPRTMYLRTRLSLFMKMILITGLPGPPPKAWDGCAMTANLRTLAAGEGGVVLQALDEMPGGPDAGKRFGL